MKTLTTILFSFCLLARMHGQETLYAATGSLGHAGELYVLDPATGATLIDVGPLNDAQGHNYSLTGLRFDTANGILYGITSPASAFDRSYLVTVNPTTAFVTPIGPLGSRMTDIAYDATTNTLLAVSGSSDHFYTINLATGAGVGTGTTNIFPQEGGGFTANAQGALFGVTLFNLYTYNSTTGQATLVGPTGLLVYVRALAFDSSGVLYGIDGGTWSLPNQARNLVTFNTSTGLAQLVGPTVNNLDALAFVPTQ